MREELSAEGRGRPGSNKRELRGRGGGGSGGTTNQCGEVKNPVGGHI